MSILKANRIENLTTTDGGISLDNSGRVLMGTTTEGKSDADDLTVASSGDTGITVRSGTSSTGNLYFSDGTSGNSEFRGYVQYNHTDNALLFGANAGVKGRFLSGGGLCFGTDSAQANALNDYEEGTWTPQLYVGSTQQSLDVSYGIYRKIGSLVFIKCHVSPSSVSGSGAVQIRNLPFTQASGGLNQTAVSIQWSGTLGEYGVYANIWRTNDVVQFARSNAGGNTGSLEGTDIGANSNFGIAGCYEV